MLAEDIFAGPIIRRAQQNVIAIWLATRKRFNLAVWVRPVGSKEWTGHTVVLHTLKVFANLYVDLAIVTPATKGALFPTNQLLEYSISLVNDKGEDDHSFFEQIVRKDKLSYPGFALPTLYLQAPSQDLCALYASCRKIHDKKGGTHDALAFGDDLISNNTKNLSTRPAVLCLTGDQIYADDVHDRVFDEITRLAQHLSGGSKEKLPEGQSLPGKGQRQDFVTKRAKFTSGAAKNHLVTLAEYVAMYGLAWCRHNWLGGSYPEDVQGYVDALPKVRRLMANVPTYMVFDDHDVTDDWNLSVRWREDVWAYFLGRRIVSNALYGFWLFQAWGNDPDQYKELIPHIIELNDYREDKPNQIAEFFWAFRNWEFHTPTYPFIYFLNTRTQRGHRDGSKASDRNAPAYLKRVDSWVNTVNQLNRLLEHQSRDYPLVLVAPAPVFGFELVDALQWVASNVAGPYPFDLEGWAANLRHLLLFLGLCSDRDVVLLSGDVHYSYTSTVKFSNFDDDFARTVAKSFPMVKFPKTGEGAVPTYQFLYASKFIQLTSSAAKNYAHGLMQTASRPQTEYSYFVNNVGELKEGTFKNGELRILKQSGGPHSPQKELVAVKLEDYKPSCAFYQRYNDAYNSPYISEHNIGFVRINKRKIENAFLTKRGQTSKRSWDFANNVYWEGATP